MFVLSVFINDLFIKINKLQWFLSNEKQTNGHWRIKLDSELRKNHKGHKHGPEVEAHHCNQDKLLQRTLIRPV